MHTTTNEYDRFVNCVKLKEEVHFFRQRMNLRNSVLLQTICALKQVDNKYLRACMH